MAVLFMMVGIPGSGKSTYARKLAKETGAEWVSRDKICFSMFPKPTYTSRERRLVRAEFINEIRRRLDQDQDVIADATFLTTQSRRLVLQELKGCARKAVAILVDTPLEIALERNSMRDDSIQVSDNVIWNMYSELRLPNGREGIDELRIVSGITGNLKRIKLLR